jgi:3-oxoacyl-[acyl-carrier protein] reductase
MDSSHSSQSAAVVLVTGAAKGIGEGIAVAFAEQGACVVLADIDEVGLGQVAEKVEALGAETLCVPCDVSSGVSVAALMTRIQERFGKLDVLVNNAGIYPPTPFTKMQENDWDRVLDINLKSVYFMSKQALPLLPEGGRIINISSIASAVAFAGLSHYSASKAGMNGLTRGLALELAPQKVTVNAIAPGAIDTPGAHMADMDPQAREAMLSSIPLGRQGTPQDIAAAATFLASEKASYITGQVLTVDGGWTLRV